MNDSQSSLLTQSKGLTNQNVQQGLFSDSALNDLLAKVQSGQLSINDALKQAGAGGSGPGGSKVDVNGAWGNQQRQNFIDLYGANGIPMANSYLAETGMANDPGFRQAEFNRQLALNPTTGGMLATQNVQNNPLFQEGLNAEKTGLNQWQDQLKTGQSLFGQQKGLLDKYQNQGFQLQPEDQTLYGQTSGNIARLFGQQGNQAASDLAMRGLSNSGAAGATFSGLAGNQNEMLAQAQQQIMQQRFQNTMNQIQQQQKFMSDLNAQNNQAAGGYSSAAGKYADTAGQYQKQAYDQNLSGIQQQQAQANDNAKNSNEFQSLLQNEGNEQFAQRQATGAGSVIGQVAGLAGGLGGLAGGMGSLFGSKAKPQTFNFNPAGGSPSGNMGAGTPLPWGSPEAQAMGPRQPPSNLYGPAF